MNLTSIHHFTAMHKRLKVYQKFIQALVFIRIHFHLDLWQIIQMDRSNRFISMLGLCFQFHSFGSTLLLDYVDTLWVNSLENSWNSLQFVSTEKNIQCDINRSCYFAHDIWPKLRFLLRIFGCFQFCANGTTPIIHHGSPWVRGVACNVEWSWARWTIQSAFQSTAFPAVFVVFLILCLEWNGLALCQHFRATHIFWFANKTTSSYIPSDLLLDNSFRSTNISVMASNFCVSVFIVLSMHNFVLVDSCHHERIWFDINSKVLVNRLRSTTRPMLSTIAPIRKYYTVHM